ncbi:MAG TPA: aminotransferase class V-fold PLP-dependent enzyme, partial [Roseiflexaceae bacterium]|nr:aminotransferase class V-fold PLP-dependent enzyme [Roseiflexaceae bacterium]
AELTHNDAAYVCTGAAAGLFLATMACRNGGDLSALDAWPAGPRAEVIIHRAHRIPYDSAVRLAGARLVEIGDREQTAPEELEAALNEDTAAVLFVAGAHLSRGALPLEQVVALAHARGVPVIVDGAAQLPPPENLWAYTRDAGADLAIFSGGKDLRGPQASGLVVGRADLIEACRVNGTPNQRYGRPMKVGKEEMVGLLAAVELYLAQDHLARIARFEQIVAYWVESLGDLPGVTAQRTFPNEAGQPMPRALISFDPVICRLTGAEMRERLWEGDPRVAAAPAGESGISITPDTLEPGEEELVAERIRALLMQAQATRTS